MSCQNIDRTSSKLPYKTPNECLCQEGYQWYSKGLQCLKAKEIAAIEKPIIPNDQTESENSGVSAATPIIIVLVILFFLSSIGVYLIYRYKKFCFKK